MTMLSRRTFLRTTLRAAAAGLAAPALAGASPLARAAGGEKRNVLFIAVDDLRPELGCYGHPHVKSPNMDRLAASGTRFTRTYCQQAICAPSRASLLTGLRPDSTGIYDLRHPVKDTLPHVRTLPQHFRAHGYHTVSLGKIYHHGSDDPKGWSERPGVHKPLYADRQTNLRRWRLMEEARKKGLTGSRRYNYAAGPATECLDVPDEAYGDGAITDAALRILRERKDEAFFLAVGYWKPHLPFTAPKRYWDLYDRSSIPVPDGDEPDGAPPLAFTNWGELRAYTDIPKQGDLDEAKTRQLIHGYWACVTFVDRQIGRLLDALDALGLAEKTVVILWGDHGWKLGEYGDWCKHTNFELDTHVPMLLCVPGAKAGQTCAALTEYVDIYPTLAEACGLAVPEHCEGTSMMPLLANPGRPWKTAAFSQYPRGRNLMGYSLRHGTWRYTEWRHRKTGEVVERELYDHSAGPLATENLVAKPERADLVKRFASTMEAGWQAARP
ncbi:MAG: sulfatase [Phycisphaerae bacterium]